MTMARNSGLEAKESGKIIYKDADLGNVNASGHTQQLERQFSLISIISVATTVGNVWVALGETIVSVFDMLLSLFRYTGPQSPL